MLSDEILKQFLLCREWLSKVDKTETFNTNQGSYSYKHMVEGCFRRYVCNGAFIAAAISLGIPIQRCRLNNPNVYLKISQESVNEMVKYTKYDQKVID
ncbi:hypothetical protein [Okeania sp. KiyG1]|uniref:hypothetical protein n=1 Tax=Okeania sp. KiyG1 TaxID=2720165 RepID=UPI0019222D18|nr:hypothetical protein [Okeania sp. KiyG1]GGA34773.1 hypothetical protein CYANOKiyG1_52200 [Okeania sp. KiyG1]